MFWEACPDLLCGAEKLNIMVAKKHEWTEDELIAKILDKTDEKEFFKDIVKWICHVLAPTKRRQIIEDIRGWSRTAAATRRLSHSDFCMFIFSSRIRASELLESRMLLGESNEWVKKYFENFPTRGDQDGTQV